MPAVPTTSPKAVTSHSPERYACLGFDRFAPERTQLPEKPHLSAVIRLPSHLGLKPARREGNIETCPTPRGRNPDGSLLCPPPSP